MQHNVTDEYVPVWTRHPNEPARWYARFDVYRLLGPKRTLEAAFRITCEAEGLNGKRPGAAWYNAHKNWNWQHRAEEWDEHERDRLRAIEEDRRFDAREQRLDMIDELLTSVFNVMAIANLDHVNVDEARDWMPTMRILFKDLINAQRTELGLPTVTEGDVNGDTVHFTADELLAAQDELKLWQDQHTTPSGNASFLALRTCLAELYSDEASARRIAGQAGLDLERIEFGARSVNNWHAILTEAEHNNQVPEILAVVNREYANSKELKRACQKYNLTHVP